MPQEAFILISVTGDHTRSVLKTITRINGVKEVYSVTGAYDIIAHLQSEDMPGLGEVVSMIRAIDGVTQTQTCIALKI